MTYQQLVNKILRKFNETELSSTAEFSDASGFHAYVKDVVNMAITDICEFDMFRYPFLMTEGTVNTTALTVGTYAYSLPSDAIEVDWESFYIDYDVSLTNKEAYKLYNKSINVFERDYLATLENSTTSAHYGKPTCIARGRDNKIYFNRKPDEAYVVKFKYFKFPTELTSASDTTEIPSGFTYVIEQRCWYYLHLFREEIEDAQLAERKADLSMQKMSEILIPIHNVMTIG